MTNNIKLSKIIFNTKMNIIINKNKKCYRNLIKELNLYPNIKKYTSLVNIYIDTKKRPTTQIFNKNIFNISTRFLDVFWIYKNNEIKDIIIITKFDKTNIFIKMAYYFLGKDLDIPENLLCKYLHELVFVPTQFFNPENTIIHGACIKYNENTNILGGLGGVGKTSATLQLKGTKTTFISDNMIIIDKNKMLHPNYAYPKVYAYNVDNNKKLKKEILKGSSIIYKLLFNIISKISKNHVRKRINPQRLYNINNLQHNKINNYFLLNKIDDKNLKIKKINSKLLSNLSWQIINVEYSGFINQLLLHDYKCKIYNVENHFNFKTIKENKLNLNKRIFKNTNNNLILIPKNLKHKNYLDQIKKMLIR